MARCPCCRREAKSREQNPAFPFCSPRCRAVDLGKWFTGEYRVPDNPGPDHEPEGLGEDSEGAAPAPEGKKR
jgi:endogenous inhibitor of DNA gyrase (YacG/DUF329 family)